MKELYLNILNEEEASLLIKHIQFNIQTRFSEVKYQYYRRIDIFFEKNGPAHEIEWNDRKTARIKCGLPNEIVSNLIDVTTTIAIYKCVYNCLLQLWNTNGWKVSVVDSVFEMIEKDNYESSFYYDKVTISPNKTLKARFYCQLYPTYANYYLHFLDRKNKIVQSLFFLKGQPDVLAFFLFFRNRYWENEDFIVSDLNREIFYTFNTKGKIAIHFRPIHNSMEDCKNYVSAFDYSRSRTERLKLLKII